MLREQRDFIKSLLEEKQKNDTKIMATPNHVTINMSADSYGNPWRNGDSKNEEPSDLDEYSLLMQKMLQEINSCKTRLEQNRHSRIRSGVLNIHSREILQFQLQHGQSIIQRFDHSLFVYVSCLFMNLHIDDETNILTWAVRRYLLTQGRNLTQV